MGPWLRAAILTVAASCAAAQDGMTTVTARIVADEIAGAPSASTTTSYVTSLGTNGLWSDVNYTDRSNTAWDPATHTARLQDMVQAYRKPGHALYGSASLSNAIHLALNAWISRDPQSDNWWYNVIDTPRKIGRTLLVLGAEATAAERTSAQTILNRSGFTRTGQNLIWEAGNVLVKGLINASSSTVAQSSSEMAAEIVQTTAEGIQYDYSFHQHGPQLYTGGYGSSFASDTIFWADMLRDTVFDFPSAKQDILANYLLVGVQWTVWGDRWDFSVKGREISRGTPGAGGMVTPCQRMAVADTARAAQYTAFADTLNGDAPAGSALTGNRHFWKSDHMVHRRPSWYTSARMCSTRVQGSEAGNEENLMGYYLGDGTTWLMRDAREFENIQPAWDWRKLPGVTCPQNSGALPVLGWDGYYNGSAFVGGASDGQRGLATMDFSRDGLKLKKSWFFFDDEFVCLGAGIAHTANTSRVTTTVNQCLRRSNITVNTGGVVRTLATGTHALTDLRWVHHDGVGYVPLGGSSAVTVTSLAQTGSWYAINHSKSTAIVTQNVFTMWFDHGSKPTAGAYAYLVLPGATTGDLPAYAAAPPVSVVTNTTAVQAVHHPGLALLQIAFHQAGAVRVPGGMRLEADRPCLVMAQSFATGLVLSVSHPSNTAVTVTARVDRAVSGTGASWRPAEGLTLLSMSLPTGNSAGSSLVRAFKTVATNAPALNADYGPEAGLRSATVFGRLTRGGPARVAVVWDTADRGTNAASWNGSVWLPLADEGDFEALLSGLAAGTRYVYRCLATNELGVAWSGPLTVKTLSQASVQPSAIPGLALWLDASDVGGDGSSRTNHAPVAIWADKSGYGRNGTGVNTPTVETAALNGSPAIRLASQARFDIGDVEVHSNTNGMTLFAVCAEAEGIEEAIVSKNYWSAGRREWVLHSGDFQIQERADTYDASCRIDFTPTAAPTVYAGRWVPASATELYRDGALLGRAATAATNMDDTTATLLVGAANNGDVTRFFTGLVAEVVIYSRALTTGELAQVGAYVSDKYGLATDYPALVNADSDDDGLPDSWERAQSGGVAQLTGQGGADADGDGATDWAEWVAGTAATNPASRLALTQLRTAAPAATQVILSWASVDGRSYGIQTSTNAGPLAFADAVTHIPATPPLNVCTVEVRNARTFFRVQVEP